MNTLQSALLRSKGRWQTGTLMRRHRVWAADSIFMGQRQPGDRLETSPVWRCSVCGVPQTALYCHEIRPGWTEAELRLAWGDR